MNRSTLDSLFADIRAFLLALGFEDEQLNTFDKANEYFAYKRDHDGSLLRGLTYLIWSRAVTAFPSPHSVSIRITDVDFISNDTPVSEQGFQDFIERARNGRCTVSFRFDKDHLCSKWGLESPGYRTRLFFFGSTFESLLQATLGSPASLEQSLWQSATAAGLRVFIRDRDVHFEGPYLFVLGGSVIDSNGVTNEVPSSDLLARIVSEGQERCRWDWPDAPSFLTPLHLRFTIKSDGYDSLSNALLAHWANLSLIYTANRVRVEQQLLLATIGSGSKKCRVQLITDSSREVVSGSEHITAWGVSVESAYDERWGKDRLTMLRIILAREYAARRQPVRLNTITAQAPRLSRELDGKWTAFIDGKVEEFTDEAAEFEKDISETVEAFDEQVSEMVKGLSTTIVAAIGVTVAAIAAATTKNSVSPDVIRWTLLGYGLYLILIPGVLTTSLHCSRLRAIESLFEKRKERFSRILTEDIVTNILGRHVESAKTRFRLSFYANVGTLVAAIGACVGLANFVHALRT